MATRQSMDDFIHKCEEVIKNAQDQFSIASKQNHYQNDSYTDAMQQLEGTYNELADLARSANGSQREQLHRMRLQIQQMQNSMTLLDHFGE
ncbi:YtzC family protein [Bacillus sp. DNRA2]|uniref:YtzC family protein n=1 Tax=Bacillus sp. DNRA2 TaxID=2723053 RepID=UPI00145D5B45|nr:YtzC family protein [Bacillus sp. DNRA2]NMD72154.1 YtzC family protein [Bacillus sp. DNRA2]